MRKHWIIVMAIMVVIAAGCAPIGESLPLSVNTGDNELSSSQPVPTEPSGAIATPFSTVTTMPAENPIQPTQTSGPIAMPSSLPPVEKFVGLAKKDLAASLNFDVAQISLGSTMAMVWPNAALGCPRPGKVYAQGRVPGYKIWLSVGEQEYIYHTDLTGQVVFCPEENLDNLDNVLPQSGGPTQDPNIGVPIK